MSALTKSPLITRERIQQSIRARFNPIPSLTPHLLGNYLDAFRLGFFRNIALAWDAMERRDDKLAAVIPKRKKSVARHGWEILTINNSAAALQQKAALEFFYNQLTATNALEENETGGLSLLIRQMMDAVGKRYAVHEIIWQPQGSLQQVSPHIRQRERPAVISGETAASDFHPSLTATFRFCPLWWFEGTQGGLRFLPTEFALYGTELESGGWLITVGDGLMEACSVAYVFKHLPLRDWLSYSEKFGMPGLLGKTEASLGSAEWAQLEEAIGKFSQDWSAVCAQGNSIELVEAGGHGDGPFAALVERMDRAMTVLWRGGDLGTLSSRDAAGASLQADESALLEADDAQLISETLDAQVSRRVLAYYFGDAPALAYLKIRTSEREEIERELKIDQFLLAAGVPLSVKDALERYNRPMPAAGETLLQPSVSSVHSAQAAR